MKKTMIEMFRFLLTNTVFLIGFLVLLPLAIAIAFFQAIRTLIFGEPESPTGPFARAIILLGLVGIVAFFAHGIYTAEPVSIRKWASPQECFEEHIEASEDAFTPLNGDNPCDLIRHCEWAFKTGAPAFSGLGSVHWVFTVKMGPDDIRKQRITEYFAPSKTFRDMTACNKEFEQRQELARQERISEAQQALLEAEQIRLCDSKGAKNNPRSIKAFDRYTMIQIVHPEDFKIAEEAVKAKVKNMSKESLCAGYH